MSSVHARSGALVLALVLAASSTALAQSAGGDVTERGDIGGDRIAMLSPRSPSALSGVLSTQYPQQAEAIVVTVRGSDGVAYTAGCTITTDDGDEAIALEGQVPDRHAFTGSGLSCRFIKVSGSGTLDVEVRKGTGSVSRSSISGVNVPINITVR